MCFDLSPTHEGEVQPLVVILEEAHRIDASAVPHCLIHHQDLKVDAPGLIGKEKMGTFCNGRWKNTCCLGDQLY